MNLLLLAALTALSVDQQQATDAVNQAQSDFDAADGMHQNSLAEKAGLDQQRADTQAEYGLHGDDAEVMEEILAAELNLEEIANILGRCDKLLYTGVQRPNGTMFPSALQRLTDALALLQAMQWDLAAREASGVAGRTRIVASYQSILPGLMQEAAAHLNNASAMMAGGGGGAP